MESRTIDFVGPNPKERHTQTETTAVLLVSKANREVPALDELNVLLVENRWPCHALSKRNNFARCDAPYQLPWIPVTNICNQQFCLLAFEGLFLDHSIHPRRSCVCDSNLVSQSMKE